MANIANVTVKKADGTTDIVYTAVQGSSGYGSNALWRQEDASVPVALRPVLKMRFQPNGNNNAMRPHFEYSYPHTYTDTTTGLKKQANIVLFSSDGLMPTEVPDAIMAEAVHQFTNLLVNTHVRDHIKSMFSPS